MLYTNITQKTKCDFSGCKNLASVMISHNSDLKKRMCFCDECIDSLYKACAKTITPKAIEAPFKKQKKLR